MNNTSFTIEKTSCYHCGELCDTEASWFEDKPFCCEGCKMVYRILDDNELCTYYDLEENPGISFKKRNRQKRFEYLEDESVKNRIADFRSGGYLSVTFYIPNIHCTSCIWLLEKLYKLDDCITQSKVNFLKRELSITLRETETSLRSVVELLSSIGYEPEIQLEKLEKTHRSTPNRQLWLKLGVAGFAFGNIMLVSFPDYFSVSASDLGSSFKLAFGILNIALAVPVLLYSSTDYLKSAWAAIKQRGINLDVPISLGILALFLRSVYEITTGTGPGYMDSFTGLVFFLLIGKMIQNKTYERISFDRDYKSYLPISVTTIDSSNNEQSVSIDKLEPGQRLIIRNQELLPTDSILISDHCFVDYSFITGESEPVKISKCETIYAGGRIIGQSAVMDVIKEVSGSYLTNLWNNATFDTNENKPKVTSLADRISPHFTLSIITIAVVSAAFWLPTSTETAINVFTSVLIIACPCALALSTPFTLGSALNILSKNGLYIKNIDVVESLSKASAVVFDKTGTLTKTDEADIAFIGDDLDENETHWIKSAAGQSVHPLSRKLVNYFDSQAAMSTEAFEEILNRGIVSQVDGHTIVLGSRLLVDDYCSFPDEQNLNDAINASIVHVVIDNTYRGYFEIRSQYRSGLPELLESFKNQFKTFLISGDNDRHKEELKPYFDSDESLLFEQSPQQKLDFIKSLQKEGDSVLMIGDGLNDAGALKQSDFGIALSENISSFSPACDAILDGTKLSNMNIYMKFAKACIGIILISFGISLVYNVVGLSFAVTGRLSPLVAAIIMPLSSITIMLFTSITTHVQGQRMGLRAWK